MPDGDVPPVRAQLLATEHWGLLAARSTAQSEVLSRLSILLTFMSASLVSLALVGNATQFSSAFPVFAVTVLSLVAVVGLLTQIRVINIGMEDLMYVLAMNRMRAAYVDIDPGVAPYLLAGRHDDMAGVGRTYYFLGRRSDFSQLAGSTMTFIIVINGALLGLLTAAIALTAEGPLALAIVLGVVVGLAHVGASMYRGFRVFSSAWRDYEPLSPTPPAD